MKKKILIVMNTMGIAGAERALLSMLRKLDYDRYEVSLVAVIGRGELFAELPPQVRVLNSSPSHLPITGADANRCIRRQIFSGMLRKGYIFKFIPYAFRNLLGQIKTGRLQLDKLFWRLLADNAPIVDEHFDLAIAYIEGAATYYTADHVNADHKVSFMHINYVMAGYNAKLDRSSYAKMERVYCVSDEAKRVFEEVFPDLADRARLFYNIVDADDIRKKSEQPGGFDDDFDGLRILSVGRLHIQKGLDIAIDAVAKLTEMGYNLRWYVLGEGGERERLTAQIAARGIEERFVLLGTRQNPYPYVAQCDLYLQPSRFEGMCIALLEAVMLSKPIITTNFDGIPQMMENGKDGLIIDLSVENLVDAIKRLADNPDLRSSLADGASRFNYNRAGSVEDLYKVMEGSHE